MAEIGNFGKLIVFQVSDKKVLTFQKFRQKVSGSWNNHSIIGSKDKKEFNGPGLRTLSLQIVLDVTMGIRPRKMMEAIEKAVEKGTAEYVVIGGKKVGKNQFVITSMSEAWDILYNGGQLARATLELTLEEYV